MNVERTMEDQSESRVDKVDSKAELFQVSFHTSCDENSHIILSDQTSPNSSESVQTMRQINDNNPKTSLSEESAKSNTEPDLTEPSIGSTVLVNASVYKDSNNMVNTNQMTTSNHISTTTFAVHDDNFTEARSLQNSNSTSQRVRSDHVSPLLPVDQQAASSSLTSSIITISENQPSGIKPSSTSLHPTNVSPPRNANKDGSLLRLFKSELFDTFFHMYYLYHRQDPGVQDYLINQLHHLPEEDIHFYLPQLCYLCLARYQTSILHRVILEKAAKSMHLALKSSWLFQSCVEEGPLSINESAIRLNQEVEMAVVNSKPIPPGSSLYSPALEVHIPDLFARRRVINKLQRTSDGLFEDRRYFDSNNRGETILYRSSKISAGTTTTAAMETDSNKRHEKSRLEETVQITSPLSKCSQVPPPRQIDNSIEEVSATIGGGGGGLPVEIIKVKDAESRQVVATLPITTTTRPRNSRKSIRRGFVQRTSQVTIAGAKVALPSVYHKLRSPLLFSAYRDTALMDAEMQQHIVKQRRSDYFNLINAFTSTIIEVSNRLALESDRNLRLPLLQRFLDALNEWMLCRRCVVAASEGIFQMTGPNIPLSEFGSLSPIGPNAHSTQIVRFLSQECKVLSSKKRAPYLLVFEVADLDEDLQQLPPIFRLQTTEFTKAVEEFQSGGDPVFKQITQQMSRPIHIDDGKKSDRNRSFWNHLYVYNCILKELDERGLYLAPDTTTGQSTSTTNYAEDPLTALRRSMGLRVSLRRQTSREVDTPDALNNSPDEGNNSTTLLGATSDGVPKHIREAEAEISLSPPNGVAFSDPGTTSASIRKKGDHTMDVDPAVVLELDRSISGEVSNPKESGLIKTLTMDDSVSDTIGKGNADDQVTPNSSQSEVMSLEAPGPLAASSSSVSPLTTLSTTLAANSSSMVQLHAPSLPPSKQSRRRSFHAATLRRSVSPAIADSHRTRPLDGSKGDSTATTHQQKLSSHIVMSPLPSLITTATPNIIKSQGPFSVTSYAALSSMWGGFTTGVFAANKTKEATAAAAMAVRKGGDALMSPSITDGTEADGTHTPSSADIHSQKEVPVAMIKDLDCGTTAAEMAANAKKVRHVLWGDLWKDKKERYRQTSPYGCLKSWNLACVLVKGGDDVRQEMLASQLIRQFKVIFEGAGLPLYLRPYEILVTGAHSGIMVFVPDTMSIDALKKKFGSDSIAKVFEAAFADNPYEAKKNFIESHAAYSIVGYLLQVKDRHNGNYLLDAEGHIIHIDYGFMLSNSPGNVNFESSPFKLTAELMDIMDGELSENYEYFRTLVVRGFVEARKHADKFLLLVEMMLSCKNVVWDSSKKIIILVSATKMPCFAAGPEVTFAALKERFMMNITENMCVSKIVNLLDASVNNWRTIQYDNFQRITNGIL